MNIIDRPEPRPQPNEAVIAVQCVGICNTDIELLKGYYDFEGIPGHEFVGTVVDCADSSWIGQRVVGDINVGCGECARCRQGDPRHCRDRAVLGIVNRDGAFAETLTLPVSNLHRVDDGISDEEAVFAEPLAAALKVSQQINLTSHERVAVLGDGKLGLLVALGLCVSNPDLTAIGKHPDHLEVLQNRKIKTVMVDRIPWQSFGTSFDVVVEATGKPDGIETALDLVHPEGIVVVKTTSRYPSKIDLARVVVDEIQIIGSRCGDLTLALSYLEKQLVNVNPLIESVYSFSEFEHALKHAQAPGSKKVLVRLS